MNSLTEEVHEIEGSEETEEYIILPLDCRKQIVVWARILAKIQSLVNDRRPV
ncbi:MAG: hypothetical protein DDT30_02103 [Dehalococcoidia bacterium]|nr:hypothetical protein [Bacillota bacterium]